MSKVNLPKLNQTGKNEWADVEDNDVALREGINSVANEQLAGEIEGSKLKNETITRAKLATEAKPLRWYTPKVIATEQSRESTEYGFLATEDKIEGVELAENGLILVGYQATWKQSVGELGNGRAAIFLGTNQLKTAVVGTKSTQKQEAAVPSTTTQFVPLFSAIGSGLVSGTGTEGYSGDVTTGQLLGQAGTTVENGGGGMCMIFAAAGTYTIGIKFKSASGSVSAKNRKFWVASLG